LQRELRGQQLAEIDTIAGRLPVWTDLDPEAATFVRGLRAPLWGAGFGEASPAFRSALAAVLRRERLPFDYPGAGVAGMELRAEPRQVAIVPAGLSLGSVRAGGEDHRGGSDAALSFSLPRGAYATMLVKVLAAEARPAPAREDTAADSR
jgi:tRNA(Glu) U13 pseudouridine synthase TruD